MRRLIISLFALACAANTYAAQKQPATHTAKFDPVPAFQSLVADASEPKQWSRLFQNPRTSKWVKQSFLLQDVKYDVKKTDSLVSPIVGTVKFTVAIRITTPVDTEAEAETNTSMAALLPVYEFNGTYTPAEKGWALQEFKYKSMDVGSPLRGQEFTAAPSLIQTQKDTAVGAVLQRWLR